MVLRLARNGSRHIMCDAIVRHDGRSSSLTVSIPRMRTYEDMPCNVTVLAESLFTLICVRAGAKWLCTTEAVQTCTWCCRDGSRKRQLPTCSQHRHSLGRPDGVKCNCCSLHAALQQVSHSQSVEGKCSTQRCSFRIWQSANGCMRVTSWFWPWECAVAFGESVGGFRAKQRCCYSLDICHSERLTAAGKQLWRQLIWIQRSDCARNTPIPTMFWLGALLREAFARTACFYASTTLYVAWRAGGWPRCSQRR